MKKSISFIVALIIVAVFSMSFAFASPDPNSSEISSTIEGTTSFAPSTSVNNNSTVFSTRGLSAAEGVVKCTPAFTTVCNWAISIVGDKITYSNVKVIIEKWDSSLLKYVVYKTQTFSYPVNPPKTFIEDQWTGNLPNGTFRASLGGTFTALENGVYGPQPNTYQVFTI